MITPLLFPKEGTEAKGAWRFPCFHTEVEEEGKKIPHKILGVSKKWKATCAFSDWVFTEL